MAKKKQQEKGAAQQDSENAVYHVPVMLKPAVDALVLNPSGTYVDCTFGGGGHSREILGRLNPKGKLYAFDQDSDARNNLPEDDRIIFIPHNFRHLQRFLRLHKVSSVDGILADLGVSSHQFDEPTRGFSTRFDAALDMRMDTSQGSTAAEMLTAVDEQTLADVIYRFGEERHARRVARAILAARSQAPLTTTGRLAEVVRRAIPRKGYSRIDPATRTFQAIRIWVNRELESLDAFLGHAVGRLNVGGRMAVITFHSLEDRIVKHTFRALQAAGTIAIRTKRPIVPSEAEVERNPRARSAKLRAAERPA
jgi:16S rRNA (cytosine1402-N4)-methyltransferase